MILISGSSNHLFIQKLTCSRLPTFLLIACLTCLHLRVMEFQNEDLWDQHEVLQKFFHLDIFGMHEGGKREFCCMIQQLTSFRISGYLDLTLSLGRQMRPHLTKRRSFLLSASPQNEPIVWLVHSWKEFSGNLRRTNRLEHSGEHASPSTLCRHRREVIASS